MKKFKYSISRFNAHVDDVLTKLGHYKASKEGLSTILVNVLMKAPWSAFRASLRSIRSEHLTSPKPHREIMTEALVEYRTLHKCSDFQLDILDGKETQLQLANLKKSFTSTSKKETKTTSNTKASYDKNEE